MKRTKKIMIVTTMLTLIMASKVLASDEPSGVTDEPSTEVSTEVVRNDEGKAEGCIDAGTVSEFIFDEPSEETVSPSEPEPVIDEEPISEPESTPEIIPTPIPVDEPAPSVPEKTPEVNSEPVETYTEPTPVYVEKYSEQPQPVQVVYDYEPEVAPRAAIEPEMILTRAAVEPEIAQTGDSGFSKIIIILGCVTLLFFMKKKNA